MISDEIRQKPILAQQSGISFESFGASPTIKSEFEGRSIIKEEQVEFLKSHAQKAGLWIESLPKGSQYLTEGGCLNVIAKGNILFFIDTVFYIM